MATSGSYDYTSNRDFIVSEAYRKIGALGDWETLDTERQTVGINALNPLVKALMAKGLPVWAITDQTINMSYFTSNPLTVGPGANLSQIIKPLKIIQALRKDTSSSIDVPMNIYTYENYELLTNKAATGAPIHLFYRPERTIGSLFLWPLPDSYWLANGQLYIRYQRPFQDFDSSTDEPDFPVEWHEALIYQLAIRLAPTYGLAPNDRIQLRQEAKEALDLALSFDQEEGSMFIRPDYTQQR